MQAIFPKFLLSADNSLDSTIFKIFQNLYGIFAGKIENRKGGIRDFVKNELLSEIYCQTYC